MAKGTDNIGSLSVEVIADLAKFDQGLTQVEERLGKVKQDVTIRLNVSEAQVNRLKAAADQIERIQKAGVTNLGFAAGTAPASGGRGKSASGGAQNVNVSFKEADLTEMIRKAAVAAFSQPIPGVKLDLDMAHLQSQLAGLRVSFTGEMTQGHPVSSAQQQQAANTVMQKMIPGLKEALSGKGTLKAVDDMVTALNRAIPGGRFGGSSVDQKFMSIVSQLGNHLNDIIRLGPPEGPSGPGGIQYRPVVGGALHQVMQGVGEDMQDVLEDAAQSFYNHLRINPAFSMARDAMPAQSAAVAHVSPAVQVVAAQQQSLARTAEAQAQISKSLAAQQVATATQQQPQQMPQREALGNIQDINKLVRYVAEQQGYKGVQQGVSLTRPWEAPEAERVAGRKAYGARGFTAYGPVGISGTGTAGIDLTDIFMAGGPGARMLHRIGEIMGQGEGQKGLRGTGQYVEISPEEREHLIGYTKQTGPAGGYPNVRAVPPREALERLITMRGGSAEDARAISAWAMRAGGPLNSRDLGGQLASSTGGMKNLSPLTSGRGMPSANLVTEAGGFLGEQNRTMVEAGAINPASKFRTRWEDAGSLRQALINSSNYLGTQQATHEQISQIREQLLGGFLPAGDELPLTGGRTTGSQLRSQAMEVVRQLRQELISQGADINPQIARKGTSLPAALRQLEREGFPVEAAGISSLFGEHRSRRGFANPGRYEEVDASTGGKTQIFRAGATFPERSGLREGRDIGVRMTPEQIAARDEYEREYNAYVRRYGRGSGGMMVPAGAEHDPFAPNLPPGSWEQRGAIGEGRIMGQHPVNLQPVVGEIDKLKGRVRSDLARRMGVSFSGVEDVNLPEGLSESAWKKAVNEAYAAHEQIASMEAEQKAAFERVNTLGDTYRRLRQANKGGYFRTGEPTQPTGDDERRRAYELSNMAPQGGVPVSIREANRGRGPRMGAPSIEGIQQVAGPGSPRFTVGSPAWQYGGQTVPPPRTGPNGEIERLMAMGDIEGAQAAQLAEEQARGGWGNAPRGRRINLAEMFGEGGGGGEPPTDEGGGMTPMGGPIHVWIDGPFPLRIAGSGGGGKAPRAAAEAASEEEAAAAATEGALPRINLSRMPSAVDTFSRLRRASQSGPTPELAQWLSTLSPEHRATVTGGIRMAPAPRSVVSAAQREAERLAKEEADATASVGSVAGASFTRAANRFRALGIDITAPQRPRPVATFGGPDAENAAVDAILRRQQASLGQRAIGPTATSAVMNFLEGQPIFQRERVLPLPNTPIAGPGSRSLQDIFGGPTFTMPGDPFSRINLARREQTEARQLARTQAGTELRLQQQTAMRDELRSGYRQARSQGIKREDLKEPLQAMGELDKQVNSTTEALAKDTKAATEHAAASQFLAKNATSAADVLGNLATGFVGGLGAAALTGTMGLVMHIGGAVAQVAQEAMKPGFEAAIGYQNVVNKVTDSLSDQVRQNYGLTQSTVALKSAQSGLSYAQYGAIRPVLEQVAGVEAGNKAYQDYIDLIRTGSQLTGQSRRGVYNTTGGFNFLGLQTPFGGTSSTMENFLNQFQGAGYKHGMFGGVATSSDFFTNFFNNVGTIGDVVTNNTQGLRNRAITLAQTGPNAINDINQQFMKVGANYRAQQEVGGAGNQALINAMQRQGVDEGKIEQVRGLGIEFTDAQGKVITDLNQIDGALSQWASALAQLDPKVWLESMTGPHGAITSQIWQIGQAANLQRSQAMQSAGLQNLINPPMRLGQIMAGVSNAPGGFASAYQRTLGAGAGIQGVTDQLQQQNMAQIQTAIGNIADPTHQAEARGLLGTLTQIGSAIQGINVQEGQIQLAAQFRSMNHDLALTKRSLSDVVGLTGKESVVTSDGTKVLASQVGIRERNIQLASRELQIMQFEHQQRSLNYQIALAGFMAEGATGEERAARLEIAKKEADYQQQVLDKQKGIGNDQWANTQEQNQRALEDTVYQYDEITKRLSDAGTIQALEELRAKYEEAGAAAETRLQTYLDEGNGMVQLAIQTGTQLIQMGTDAAKAIDLASDALTRAAQAIQNPGQAPFNYDPTGTYPQGTTLGPPAPGSPTPGPGQPGYDPRTVTPQYDPRYPGAYIPMPDTAGGGAGLIDPYLKATPLGASRQNGSSVQIINPSAGVDQQALIRVVISELNRQAALRGLPTIN